MLGNRTASATLAVLLLVTGVTTGTAFVATASAQDGGSPLGEVLDCDSDSRLEQLQCAGGAAYSGLMGAKDRTAHSLFSWFGEDDSPSAAERAEAVESYWNSHNESFERYGNKRANWSQNQTVEMIWKIDGKTATRYLLANETNGNVTTRIVESTSRNATQHLHMCGYAAEKSYPELQNFYEKFVEPDKDVTESYLAKLGGRYKEDVDTSLYPSSGECNPKGGAS